MEGYKLQHQIPLQQTNFDNLECCRRLEDTYLDDDGLWSHDYPLVEAQIELWKKSRGEASPRHLRSALKAASGRDERPCQSPSGRRQLSRD
jgi:hypothetical protein